MVGLIDHKARFRWLDWLTVKLDLDEPNDKFRACTRHYPVMSSYRLRIWGYGKKNRLYHTVYLFVTVLLRLKQFSVRNINCKIQYISRLAVGWHNYQNFCFVIITPFKHMWSVSINVLNKRLILRYLTLLFQ